MQACQGDSFEYSNRFETNCWPITDTLDFTLSKKAGQFEQLVIDLQEEYPYQNLYLKLFYESPDGKQGELMMSDTLSSPSGEWYIENKGSFYRGRFSNALELPGPEGDYRCRLIQFMREENLCGVRQVAITKIQSASP